MSTHKGLTVPWSNYTYGKMELIIFEENLLKNPANFYFFDRGNSLRPKILEVGEFVPLGAIVRSRGAIICHSEFGERKH